MKSHRDVRKRVKHWHKTVLVLLAVVAGMAAARGAETADGVAVWDTFSSFGDTIDLADRAGWKVVPADLLTLEADPSKASSDPGYYGREYEFQGDAVVETDHLIAAFQSGRGTVAIYSKADPSRKILAFMPLRAKTEPTHISRCGILLNRSDEVALEVSFSGGSKGTDSSAVVAVSRTGIIEIKPAGTMKGIRLLSPIEYGVVPGFVGDDLVFDPRQYPSARGLHVPSENLFLGLLKGENRVLVVTWPKGKQQMRLQLGAAGQEDRLIESVDFDNDGQSVYLAVPEAPGIWHREPLKPSYLEKDITIDWQRPFPAKWVTQLYEGDVKTMYTFRETRGQIWRGVPGMYTYPVWFDGDKTCYRLSKKVPPKGESIIYFLEGRNTPASVCTPVDIMRATLGRQTCDGILDFAGRKLRTHHRRGAEGVRRACTCGCTEAIQAVFDAGQEVEKSQYVEGAVDDMVYFVRRHMERIDEYRAFADDTIKFLQTAASSAADLKPFVETLERIVERIPRDYRVQEENIKTLDYADDLARRTKALTGKKDSRNLPTYKDLSEKWRAMGGAQDGLLAQYHTITRRLFQEAGYGCVTGPGAVALAQEVRTRCRQCLRNPDGYEIWPNY